MRESGTEVGDSSEPRSQGGMEVSDRNVFVVYPFNHEVQVLTAGGTLRIRWGSEGSKEGQLQNPSDIAIDGSTVYVADTGNHRVQALSFGGTFFFDGGSRAMGRVSLIHPLALPSLTTTSMSWTLETTGFRYLPEVVR